jgi:hypothetical protein
MKTDVLPSGKSIKTEGLNTAALVGGTIASKVIAKLVNKTGIVPSLAFLGLGFVVTHNAPKSDKFHVEAMGRGMQAYGALSLITELGKDNIDLGLGGLMGTTPMANPIPASVRKYISDYVPVLSGGTNYLMGVSDYVNQRAAVAIDTTSAFNV